MNPLVTEYLARIDDLDHRLKLQAVLEEVQRDFPQLELVYKWNQPMFTHERTFIISFDTSKDCLLVSPEVEGITQFSKRILEAGYTNGTMQFRIPWSNTVDIKLINEMIQYQLTTKKGHPKFWR